MAGRAAVLRTVVRSVEPELPATDRELLFRFARAGDGSAFETLVKRHAGMVLGVCRRALPTVQDAEDACQATFLVLARRAKDGRWRESVANWLYATARKVSHNARVVSERRARRETRAAVPEAVEPIDRMTGRELLAALDAALDRLPALYREPLVLCYLEGLTRDEAAARLGVPLATLHTRIDRARKRLHSVLTRAGFAPGAGLLVLAATSPAGAAPPRLVESVLAAASGRATAAVGELARGAAVNAALRKVAVALAALIGVVGVVLASSGASADRDADGSAPEHPPAPIAWHPRTNPAEPPPRPAEKAAETPGETVTFRGRVLGPDGKPVAGAKLHAEQSYWYTGRPKTLADRTATGAEGRFEFRVPKALFDAPEGSIVAATAPEYGLGWVKLGAGVRGDDLTIRLSGQDAPIAGQIVTLEGKPVPGARVTVVRVNAAPNDDLGPWLQAIKRKNENGDLEWEYLRRWVGGMGLGTTTDAQGRFELRGIGANRLVRLRLEGPAVSTQDIRVLTRAGEALTVKDSEGDPQFKRPPTYVTYYAASFRHPAPPTRPIVGVVRDRDTGKALVGATIRGYKFADRELLESDEAAVEATTDKDGRYRLVGMPRGSGNEILAVPGPDHAYLICRKAVADAPGLDPVTVDFELKRGVWIEGKIADKASGQPVRVGVEYFATLDSPNLRDHPGFKSIYGFFYSGVFAQADGSYRLVGIPGAGLVVTGRTPEHLCTTERADEFGRPEGHIPAAPNFLGPLVNFSAIAAVEVKAGAEATRRDVTLDPGWRFAGRLIGPDGRPVTGARWLAVDGPSASWTDKMATAKFAVAKFNPKRPRDILFRHAEKGLVGVLQPPNENGGAVTVRMQPGATVTGRLLDADGRPRAGVRVKLWVRTRQAPSWLDYSPNSVVTDKDGRFRIEALVPGFPFLLRDNQGSIPFGDGLRSGEVKDLGDVRLQAGE